jgi:transcriptional regulator with XRE-family HTH domain
VSDLDDVHGRVAARLRELRAERGMTLADVAARAGMDASTVSRLESGARRLTLDHLPPLARALGVEVDALLEPPPDPRVRSKALTMDGMTLWQLNRHPDGPGRHAFKILLPADRTEPIVRAREGSGWLFVLTGRVRFVLGGEDYTLDPGEAVEWDARIAHWFGVVDGPAEVVALFGDEGGGRVAVRDTVGP